MASTVRLMQGLALRRDDPQRALTLLRQTVRLEPAWRLPYTLCDLAACELRTGSVSAALRATRLQQARYGRLGGGWTSDAAIWWTHYRALLAAGRATAARDVLANADRLLVMGVGLLSDEGLRRSYLQHFVCSHAELLRAWVHEARTAGLQHIVARASMVSSPVPLKVSWMLLRHSLVPS